MTHTLYREGSDESLKSDFVFVVTGATGFNKDGCAPRLSEIMRIISTYNPINFGSMEVGNLGRGMPAKEILTNITDAAIAQAAFDDKESVIKALIALKEADLGISVTISGLTEEVKDIIKKAGIGEHPHTTNLALGFMGKRDKAASDDVRLITTMCGHHMISKNVTEHSLKMIKEGRITPMDAAIRLSKQCTCGAFNTVRAAHLLEQLAKEQ
jgi:hypothetical protein